MRRGIRFVVSCGAVGVLLAGCTSGDSNGSGESGGSSGAAPAEPASDTEQSFEQVAHKVLPSIVQINTADGLGSGVVYDDQGHIVTNAHVVGTSNTFEVSFVTGGNPVTATLVASYQPEDLAVIKVDGDLPVGPASFGDSSKLAVGQLVLAMGNPLGLSASVSNGIVSAMGRTVTEPATATSPATTIPDMIQTSAPINPGNSGGALVDMSNQVIGIPTLAATDQELGGAAPGIGFAIASNTVKRIVDQIVRDGKVTDTGRAALDILARTVADRDAQPVGVGVVEATPGGAAAAAGIQAGDVITKLNETATTTVAELNAVLVSLSPGDKVKVTFLRGTETMTKDVTLADR
ncbi:signal protein PDZ [Actinophytocola xinjiangensis]|uniref:Signal protein PDZ n=1 Tax=Actinophytocola xinjiangensis TaxID=485602 RepID=A0A7Z0WMJ1_9PSEU|nr:trypsin-like peptidase domain-containing protein [Actinophytocola xinjiangensis]OLF08462.1 signal protein PDZ [Actinophytocola xinjiangensis]